jgi:hypothetical protein
MFQELLNAQAPSVIRSNITQSLQVKQHGVIHVLLYF